MMSQTRREFLIASTALLGSASVPESNGAFAAEPRSTPDATACAIEPGWLAGDPYATGACEAGFHGRSFDAARDYALRFRVPDADRDRVVLGLER